MIDDKKSQMTLKRRREEKKKHSQYHKTFQPTELKSENHFIPLRGTLNDFHRYTTRVFIDHVIWSGVGGIRKGEVILEQPLIMLSLYY